MKTAFAKRSPRAALANGTILAVSKDASKSTAVAATQIVETREA